MMSDKIISEQPLATFVLFAYNQEKYIREAVEGAFAQMYEPLQIILSDDCSTDRTFDIMQEMVDSYAGQHEVILRKNKNNAGLCAHVNIVFQEARGDILVIAAGDDISLPDRTAISVEALKRAPDATAVLLSAEVIDDSGRTIGAKLIGGNRTTELHQSLADLMRWRTKTFGASRAIRRQVFDTFGLFRIDCPTEDTPLLLRSLICGRNVLSPKNGIRYRTHDNNLSGIASLAKMETAAIYLQYRTDIECAVQKRLITEAEATRLLRWTSDDQKVRGVRLKIATRVRLSISEFLFILRISSFGFRNKIKAGLALLPRLSERQG